MQQVKLFSFLARVLQLQERGQVFTCLNRVASSSDLILDLDEIKAKLLEHCIEAALSDIRECSAHDYVKATGLTFSMANENCYELVRLIHDFLTTDGMHKTSLWTEKVSINLLSFERLKMKQTYYFALLKF